ncbi:MAG TPA: putative sugar nucleotidyl transferase [bacterium]|nr:putative sugar nucleotidyl transferase [bacterium]
MKLIVYENDTWSNLTPLSYIRPVFELRCGMYTLLERILNKAKTDDVILFVRDYLANLVRKKYKYPVNHVSELNDDLLIVDGKLLATDNFKTDKEAVYLCDNEIVYAFVKKENASKINGMNLAQILDFVKTLPAVNIDAKLMRYPWNFIHENPEMLKKDFISCGKKGIEGVFSPQAGVKGPDDIFIGEGAEIHPFVVLDTSSGSIFIDKKARIFPFSRIEGPCYIGEDTHIMPGASIREGNSIGPVCRIGGELEESIIQGYSNKYHDGFIGHAYIGEFVNLGALTTNSDLKNDYSTVSVYVNGKPVDTGDLKVGSFIGDHTKTSIGTLFNTGTSAGVMCNITAGGILPKFFPSFVWYVNNKFMKGFGLEMMLNTARAAMDRRKRVLTQEEEDVIRKVYEITAEMRKSYIAKSSKAKT